MIEKVKKIWNFFFGKTEFEKAMEQEEREIDRKINTPPVKRKTTRQAKKPTQVNKPKTGGKK